MAAAHGSSSKHQTMSPSLISSICPSPTIVLPLATSASVSLKAEQPTTAARNEAVAVADEKYHHAGIAVANWTTQYCTMATTSVTAIKTPVAGKKKEPVDELSEEDAAKKAEIDLLVERCQDADHGIQTQALTQLRNELASSTSSM